MFILNPQSGVPIYKQLIDQVRRMIASNQLAPGDELPSVRELAVQHAVNAMTISKAYSLLEAEGLLQRQRGKPMTVAQETGRQESRAARMRRLKPAIEQLAVAAQQLQLATDDVLDAVRRKMESHND